MQFLYTREKFHDLIVGERGLKAQAAASILACTLALSSCILSQVTADNNKPMDIA
jgi:hypothetical protein